MRPVQAQAMVQLHYCMCEGARTEGGYGVSQFASIPTRLPQVGILDVQGGFVYTILYLFIQIAMTP